MTNDMIYRMTDDLADYMSLDVTDDMTVKTVKLQIYRLLLTSILMIFFEQISTYLIYLLLWLY